ncbi:putative iron-regulated membrane protein [Pedobacter sp. AK013]|uniref:PepSY-associated TM helix domain-containing protein n=1 Tax=Pedobacter sp. AK013 TaxID=2723071 RepID=UPI0016219B9F|nr:PepSY-associated TM helix domain-containing protein [Pedobacter sp. AK013]MBB6235467.1 putative iron-regulated membrane protein [Pedobacter sp. AK013]
MKSEHNRKSLNWAKHQKRWFGKWHLYLGIIAGAIVAFVGVTGSILVFQDEIDRALNPNLFEVIAHKQKMPVEEIVPLVKKNYPKLKIDYLMLNNFKNPNEAYSVMNLKTGEETFINPYTGKIGGKRIHTSSFIHIVTELHRTLLIPVAGRYICGLASLCLLILTISGLRLWLPKKWKQLKSVLTVRFSGSFKRQNYDWHNSLGFYSSPIVAILSLTGFSITFSTLVIPLLFVLSGKSPQGVAKLLGAKSAWHAQAVPLPLKEIVAASKEKMPNGYIGGIAFPADKTGAYRLDMVSGNLPKVGKREMLIIDQYTAQVLLNSRKDFPNVGNAYLSWLTPIHYGSFGGRPTQVIAIIAGLIPLALFITGFIIWWPRYKKQKKGKRKTNEAALDEVSEIPKVEKEPKPAKIKTQLPKLGRYFLIQFKLGLKYVLIIIPISFMMGALYGLPSGIIIQPAIFVMAFSCVMVCLNFICALLSEIFNILFLLPFKRGSHRVTRYFALSTAFFVCYLAVYMVLLNTGLAVF